MEGDPMSGNWRVQNFDNAPLGDRRRSRRWVQLATDMRARPQASLPASCRSKARLAGAYRLLSNPRVDPHAIPMPHRQRTAGQCAELPSTLCVQDTTQLDFSQRAARGSIRGVGPMGSKDGGGQGLVQHAALAVTPEGRMLGVLHQQWHCQHRTVAGQTRRDRRQRSTEADVWKQTALAVSKLDLGATRLLHVGDRHSDVFDFMREIQACGHGFVLRAMHDRYVDGDACRLWEKLESQPWVGHRKLAVTRRSGSPKQKRAAREAELSIRFCGVSLQPPRNDPRFSDAQPLSCYVVQVLERDAPQEGEALNWTLLCSEPITDAASAWQAVDWYTRRWVIEEWHRVLKEGCRLESAQLDDADDIKRLAAIQGPIAADLLSLRDLADHDDQADNPHALKALVSPAMLAVVAMLLGKRVEQVTPRQFWQKLAAEGGYLARKNDPRPGWKVLWRGWQTLASMAQGFELARKG